tara:strand:- start:424 stop:3129 length:2706 start_codon:yes stop_codon:yes gene_type:complete
MLISENTKNKDSRFKAFKRYIGKSKINQSLALKILFIFAIGGVFFTPIGLLRSESRQVRSLSKAFARSLRIIDTKYDFLAREIFLFGDNLFGISYRYIKSSFNKPDEIKINISFENFQKLNQIRNKAMKESMLVRTENDKVNGYISYRARDYPIRLRLKGDWTDHLLGDKWSFRIQTKKNNAFLGMDEFSLQHPRTRNYINAYVFHNLLKYEELPYLRYKFIPVSLNGKYLGIYALEEHFSKTLIENSGFREGPIIKLSDQDIRGENKRMMQLDNGWAYRRKNYFHTLRSNADITTFNLSKMAKQPEKISQFKLGSKMLDELLKKKLNTSDVFDLKMTAKYFAICDLMSLASLNTWYDMRFYFNPILARFIPIGYDAQPPIIVEKRLLSIDKNPLNLFDDDLFVHEYMRELERISKDEYFDEFIDQFTPSLNKALGTIHKSYPFVRFFKNEITKNQKYIRNRLSPLSPVGLKAIKPIDNSNLLKLELYNKTKFPIEVLNIVRNGVIYNVDSNNYLPSIKKLQRVKSKEIKFKLFREINDRSIQDLDSISQLEQISSDQLSTIIINYRVYGTSSQRSMQVKTLPWSDSRSELDPLVSRDPTYQNFNSLIVDKDNQNISIITDLVIEKPLILPIGYKLTVEPGVKLSLVGEGLILVQGAVNIVGLSNDPISIQSNNGGKGIIVLNSPLPSYINHVTFNGLEAPANVSLNITGGLSFYNSSVSISNTKFINSNSEDALNLVKSSFSIKNTYFANIASDAIDLDFSNGQIQTSTFNNIGNDSIDISGAEVLVDQVKISSSGDKAISVGERSKLYANNIDISDAFIGIASKDLSSVVVKELSVNNVQICIAAYQKKPEYGPGFIELENSSPGCSSKYVLETGSSITSAKDYFFPNTDSAYKQLYLK